MTTNRPLAVRYLYVSPRPRGLRNDPPSVVDTSKAANSEGQEMSILRDFTTRGLDLNSSATRSGTGQTGETKPLSGVSLLLARHQAGLHPHFLISSNDRH